MARTKNFDVDEVLNKALDLFWTKGYHATSIQDLVGHLGINRASIYDTWGDKHNLYLESLKRYRQQSSSWLLQLIRSEKSAKEIIKDFLLGTVDQSINDGEQRGCFIVNATTELANQDPTIQTFYIENKKTLEKVLIELISEGQSSGEITSKHSSEALARFVFNNITGLRVMAKGTLAEKEFNEIVDVTLSALD